MDNKRKILIIDDMPANLELMAGVLKDDYNVQVATSGEKGLRLAREHMPDLILLDVMMPGMSGYDVCRRLKAEPELCDIPVIFVTALDDHADEAFGLQLGAVDYIVKPVVPGIVMARVKSQLALKNERDLLESQNAWLKSEVERRMNELKEAQAFLFQSEKMASLGLLAAGIVHEINNPLSYVYANLEGLKDRLQSVLSIFELTEKFSRQLPEDQPDVFFFRKLKEELDYDNFKVDLAELIEESIEGAVRARKIIQNLREFSHMNERENGLHDIESGIDATLNIVNNELKYKAEIIKEYGGLEPINCVGSQINQVVMNLLVNAAQAIEKSGKIIIRTGSQDSDRVWIEVEDTGCGMSEEVRRKVFEPFFTTKPVGQGTGLGLSLSYKIIKEHGGTIDLTSELGKGTKFRVYLPVNKEVEPGAPL
ncbi:MAG: hybrid sensor histidine kinase/response regulator [Gammaproteobacteria bacterium HGW-Gammaproteobacteria-10]|nr:MAG: hybrid sensor histidine kinase/response regulator [Gammaproteobacteria bacterium HGW-Gammaproteobacteria-10]